MSARRPSRRAPQSRDAAKTRRAAAPKRAVASAKRAKPAARKPALAIVRGSVHAAHAQPPRPVGFAIVTVSDTRRGRDDVSGARAHELIDGAGHEVVRRAWVHDDVKGIRRVLQDVLALDAVDAVVVTGGTGLAPRDVTPEAVEPLYDRALPGFGERFRARSAEQVGAAAWLSRASAGVVRGRLVVLLPGSTAAVDLALRELLLPEIVHAVRLLGRFDTGE